MKTQKKHKPHKYFKAKHAVYDRFNLNKRKIRERKLKHEAKSEND